MSNNGTVDEPRRTHLADELIRLGVGPEGGRHSNRKIAGLAGISHEQLGRMLRSRGEDEDPYPWRPKQLDAIAQALREVGEIVTNEALRDASLRDLGYGRAVSGDSLSVILDRLPDLSDSDRRLVLAQLARYLDPNSDGDRG